jgi:serine/threonine protein kinase
MTAHLTEDQIRAFVLGQDDGIPLEEAKRHLTKCRRCAAIAASEAGLEHALWEVRQRVGGCPACGWMQEAPARGPCRCDRCGASLKAGAYGVREVLTTSDHGRLYLAVDGAGREVELAEIHFARVSDVQALASFEREASVLRRLAHPRILRVIGSFIEGDGAQARLYVVQQHGDEARLSRQLDDYQLTEHEAAAITPQARELLGYLQELSPPSAPRDVSPANTAPRPDDRLEHGEASKPARADRGTQGSTAMAPTSNNPSMRVRLMKAGKVVRSFKIKPETFTIGSGQEATVRIGGVPDLAPKHALIWLDDGVPTLVPSSGCTVLVNGSPTSHSRLRPNDLVSLGKLDLQIESLLAPVPAQAPAPVDATDEIDGLEGGATQVSTMPYPAPPAAPPPRPAPPPWMSAETLRSFDEEDEDSPDQATTVAAPSEIARLREESTSEYVTSRQITKREVVQPPVYPSRFGEDETTMPGKPSAAMRPSRPKDLPELELTEEERQALADLLPFATPVPAQMPRSADDDDDGLGTLTEPPDTFGSGPPVHDGVNWNLPPQAQPAPQPPYQRPAPQPQYQYQPPQQLQYQQPAPQPQYQYQQPPPQPQYQQPAPQPQYQQPPPQPQYQYQQPAPQPQYQYQQPAPQPQYQQPLPQTQLQYQQPAPQLQYQQPAPPPQPQYQQPAPQPQYEPQPYEQPGGAEPRWFDAPSPSGDEQAPAVPSSELAAAPGPRVRVFDAALPFRFPEAKGDGTDEDADEPFYVPPKRRRRHVRRDVFARLVAAPVAGAEGHVAGTVAAEVICQGEGRLWEMLLVEPGTSYPRVEGEPALVRMGPRGQCAIAAPKRATGTLWIGGAEKDLRKQPVGQDGMRQVLLSEGDRALIREKKASHLVTVTSKVRTDRTAILADIHLLEEDLRPTKQASVRVGRLVSLVMVLGLAAGIVALVVLHPASEGPLFEEMSLVDIALAPADEAEDEPEEEAEDAEDAAAAKVQSAVRRAPRAGGGKASSTNNLLAALRGGGGSSGGPSLQDVIGNISSVGGAGAFSSAGLLPGLPGETGPFARSGGGGGVQTLGGGALGKGVGQIEGSGGKRGKIRGRVQNVSSQARVQGNLDRAEVLRAINGRMGAITRCYESRLMNNPTLGGRLVFGWTITTSGGASGVAVRSSTLSDPAVASCISGIIRGIRFPRPEGGSVQISFPFLFRAMDI